MDIVEDAIRESEATKSMCERFAEAKGHHETLSDYVIGQDSAKKALAVACITTTSGSTDWAIKTAMWICPRATSS